ncbi:MAG: peptidase C1 [Calditrichaeota bacterium]|nr:MAG: peptidase C1 [Calditrichota bacterium]
MMSYVLAVLFLFGPSLFAQQPRRDHGKFMQYKNEFLDKIKKETRAFATPKKKPRMVFKMDFTGMDLPKSVNEFTRYWHNPPISQGMTGTCWCFSTTSFFESEIYRQTHRKLKLSEMYTVYWEYVEKARRFVREHGNSAFGQGSEANAVSRIWKMYGIVPEKDYTGMKPGQKFHDHSKMFAEMKSYLEFVKKNHIWNEAQVLANIKSILNYYMGEPPKTIVVDGKKMTPKEYLTKVVKLNLDDYIDFMSLMEKPYYQMVEYEVPDNWWHSKEYYNIPLDKFMAILKQAVRKGYTVCLGGDVTEAGYESHAEVAMVPTFDIPAEYIDENARQFRFSNHSTTDDHGIHLVGYMEKNGKDWYLIKDSGSGSRNGKNPGYYFYHEDYIKLKMMNIMVHKDAAAGILEKLTMK